MVTAILLFFLLFMAYIIFLCGAYFGARKTAKAIVEAMDQCELSSIQKLELLRKIKDAAKK